jgi:hypothetical protein
VSLDASTTSVAALLKAWVVTWPYGGRAVCATPQDRDRQIAEVRRKYELEATVVEVEWDPDDSDTWPRQHDYSCRFYHVTGRHAGREVDIVVPEYRARRIKPEEHPSIRVELVPEDHCVSYIGTDDLIDWTAVEERREKTRAEYLERQARLKAALEDDGR